MKAVVSWSGGKDSCFATMQAFKLGYTPTVLLNMMNENAKVSRSHGLTTNILQQQALQLNLPLIGIPATWSQYESKYIQTLTLLKTKYDVEAVIFGDIDLEPHKQWEEKVCTQTQLQPILPLWQQDRLALVYEMINQGIECVIVSCNTTLGPDFLGKTLNKTVINALIKLGIDPCGENGEFHTVVVHCPLFKKPVVLPKYRKEIYKDYCFLVWEDEIEQNM